MMLLAAVALSAIPADPSLISRSMTRFEFKNDPSEPSIIFAATEPRKIEGQEETTYHFWPTIFVVDEKSSKLVSFEKGAKSTEWVHAAAFPAKGYYWGFLESAVDGPAPEIQVVHSTDKGRTWKPLAPIIKSTYLARLHDFRMDDKGHGSITLRAGDEAPPKAQGFYVYVTKNWGKSWAKPTFTKDVLFDAQKSDLSECSFRQEPTETIPADCALPAYVTKPTPAATDKK